MALRDCWSIAVASTRATSGVEAGACDGVPAAGDEVAVAGDELPVAWTAGAAADDAGSDDVFAGSAFAVATTVGAEGLVPRVTRNNPAMTIAATSRIPHPMSFCLALRFRLTALSQPSYASAPRRSKKHYLAGVFEEKVAAVRPFTTAAKRAH
jgi:hypothetical protein